MKDEFRYYRNKKKIIHKRKESWFDSAEKEKVYKDNYIRINGEDDLTRYIEPKPKPKPKKKKKASKKEDK
tara:strand:- start:1984 stop:2193 length:210 start_codon:yes stop_codon:yes gene_type:complete